MNDKLIEVVPKILRACRLLDVGDPEYIVGEPVKRSELLENDRANQ